MSLLQTDRTMRLEVFKEWQALRDQYQQEGLSRNKSYKRIAEKYQCSTETVRTWLEPLRRREKNRIKREYFQHTTKTSKQKYEQHNQSSIKYNNIRINIGEFVIDSGRDLNQPFTIGELALKIYDRTKIHFHHITLENLCQKYNKRHGVNLLVKIQDNPALYIIPSEYRNHSPEKQDKNT